MILDNRQVVPDIIVSRDGVPNNSIAYNINNNFNHNQDHNQAGQHDKGKPENASPRHFPKGRSHEAPKHAYVTGNNNGSPRHVPHNGNYYSEAKMSPVLQRANKVINRDSPIHSKSSSRKFDRNPLIRDDSPHRIPNFEKRNIHGNYESPIHCRSNSQRNPPPLNDIDYRVKGFNYDNTNSKESPKKYNNFYKDVGYGSPVHQRSINPKQGIFYSPKHHPKYNQFYSPKRTSTLHLDKRDNLEVVGKESRFQLLGNERFRPRSSSHPCEGSSFGPSKIPVQISKPNLKINYEKMDEKVTVQRNDNDFNIFGSPFKNLNKRHSLSNTNSSPRKGQSPELQNQEYKRILREYAIFSPKKVNIRNKNQNIKTQYNKSECNQKIHSTSKEKYKANVTEKRVSTETKWNGDKWQWNMETPHVPYADSNSSWNIESDQRNEKEIEFQNPKFKIKDVNKNIDRSRLSSWPSSGSFKSSYSEYEDDPKSEMKWSGEENELLSDKDSGLEADSSLGSKMVLIKCKDANYLTRIFVNNEGIHGLRVVGRVGVGGSAQGHVMSLDQPVATSGDFNSNHNDDVRGGSDVTAREVLSENTGSLISQTTDTEFEHEVADYQWLLDYDLPPPRYRESYSRDSNGGGRDGSTRVSVLQPSTEESHLSYETLSRNIDANLAEIDMDDFRSEDIHQLLSLPTICADMQDGNEEDIYCSVTGSLIDANEMHQSPPPHQPNRCIHRKQHSRIHQKLLKQSQHQQLHRRDNCSEEIEHEKQSYDDDDHEEEIEEEYSGVSGDVSLYQSGPLFSPLKDPPHIPPSFSVDSLDSDSIHEDLILTCQANKNNYTIAFEGSFVHYSEDSDYQEPAESDGTASGTWSTERLEGRSPAPNMTYSDQPYTTWSRVSRRSSQSRTPDPSNTHHNRAHEQSPIPIDKDQQQSQTSSNISIESSQQQGNKSNSMPNLMRRSLMRRSLETSGHCMKVYDLQNSLRSSQLSSTRSVDANNFSLMRLFIKQKSLSKEAVSMSSSCTDPSQEGACSSSENQSGVNDSSDWPMNSQSENDMDGSASPVPITALNNHIVHDRTYRARGISPNMIIPSHQDNPTNTTDRNNITSNLTEGILNNNNLTQMIDNCNSNPIDNITSFEDSLKEPNPCSKPPMTSPIREEPEGMDISNYNRYENKVQLDQSEKEPKVNEVLRLKDNNMCKIEQNNRSSSKTRSRENSNNNVQGNKNALNVLSDMKKRSDSPGTPSHQTVKKESVNTSQRKRQDSGNSSSGYASNKGSTEKIRRSSESDKLLNLTEKPKPKPRSLKQVSDQCLQTSNLKVSAMVNTSGIIDKKEVYVYYPNYALPDLGFLKEKKYSVDARIFLVPQHYTHFTQEKKEAKSKRPFSCGDMEKLKKLGFSHVRDWESLNFLLPKELKEMLLDDTECIESVTPSFCKPTKVVRRPASCEYSQQKLTQESRDSKTSYSSLNSNQPSSGFRGSSTMLNDSEEGTTPMDHRYVYRYDTTSMDSDGCPPIPKRSISLAVDDHLMDDGATPPPRPPLPRGILRKCTSLRDETNKQSGSKRHSAGDTSSKLSMREDLLKRRSLQEPINPGATAIEGSDLPEDSFDKDGVMGCSCINECTGFCAKGLRKKNLLLVDELPEVSSHEELTESDLVRLRSQVSDFLVMKGNQVGSILTSDFTYGGCDCPRKNVSFAERGCSHRGHSTNPTSFSKKLQKESSETRSEKKPTEDEHPPLLYDAHDKKTLVLSVRNAVEKLMMHFNKGNSQQEKNKLGISLQTPEVATLALDKLCPAIYALLSDGLLPSLHSLFGKISNSVWRVVEATSQIGPSTKALNDLVLTLNSEECLSEGPIKFNAFIFGLLNIRSLDAWLGYLRTRESALQKHYHPESFLYLSNTATRGLYDDLLLSLRPLALLPFRLDLLHEYKALHASLLKMEERLALHTSQSPSEAPLDILLAAKESKEFRNAAARTTDRSRSPRPRSCHENTVGYDNVQGALRKRWSGIQLGSKLVTAIDKLLTEEVGGTSSEEYTDSLDNPKKSHRHHDLSDDATDMRISDLSSKDGDISERSATDKDTDTEKGLRLIGKHLEKENESEGERFRRLQLKWEAMTVHNGGQRADCREEEQDKDRVESVTSPAGAQRSRIPRPVSITSPQQVFKPFEISREKTSPQYKQGKKFVPTKDLPKPAPRRSLKDRVIPTDHHEAQFTRGPAVRSRIGPRTTTNSSNTSALGSNRASSVPGRKMERGSSGSRLVQTLHHRLATDNGHLSFSRGDILTVIVEVDERYLLCCLHDRKGLVPRSSVVVYH